MREDCKHFQIEDVRLRRGRAILRPRPRARGAVALPRRTALATSGASPTPAGPTALVQPPIESEPDERAAADVADVLASAEEIVDAVAPEERRRGGSSRGQGRRSAGSAVKRGSPNRLSRRRPPASGEGDRF